MPAPADVDTAVVPAARETLPATPEPSFETFIQTISTAVTTIQTDVQNAKNLSEKLVLTLKEASRYGFSVAFLRRAVDNGTLKHFRDGRHHQNPPSDSG
jgi:hypothetical protein